MSLGFTPIDKEYSDAKSGLTDMRGASLPKNSLAFSISLSAVDDNAFKIDCEYRR